MKKEQLIWNFVCSFLAIFLMVNIVNANVLGDVNNDGKINLSEAVYALQVATDLKPEIPASSIFGFSNWMIRNFDEVYRAESDGFVIASITSPESGNIIIKGYTDRSEPPTTLRIQTSAQNKNNSSSFTMPVKKNDFWKVETSQEDEGSSKTLYWISFSIEQRPQYFTSCNEILQAGYSNGDGMYTIDLDGSGENDPFEVYCDMTTDGGGWTKIYELNIPSTNLNWNIYSDIPYKTDISSKEIFFSRISYKLELNDNFLWASMNDFTNGQLNRIGIPIDWDYQVTVNDLNVITNKSNLTNITGSNKGNIEFWSDCYSTKGGNDDKYDYADIKGYDNPGQDEEDCYGSLQIFNNHNTQFSFNGWSNPDAPYPSDLGIGNNPGTLDICPRDYDHPDWTWCCNAEKYNKRVLTIFVK